MVVQGRKVQARAGCPLPENCAVGKLPRNLFMCPMRNHIWMDTSHYDLAGKAGLTKREGVIAEGYSHSLLPLSVRGSVLEYVSQPGHTPPPPMFLSKQAGTYLAQVDPWMSKREDKMRFKLSLRIKLSRMEV